MDTVSLKTPSLYGNKYFLSILDDYTRYGWVIFFKSKKQVFDIFLTWYNRVKNIFNKNIKYLHSDNGTEFINNKFLEFCNQNGIIFEHTIPNTPEENGRVERFHGTLLPNARAMLQDAHLNHVFWEDAISTANYIHNRIPHKGINNNIPYEMLYNEKVDFDKFKVFGCRVFFYVPKQFRKKLSNSALPGIFIGYDINPAAYKIYDTTNNKIILSRSVVFYEDIPGNCGPPSSSPDFLNFTPYYEIGGNEDELDFPLEADIDNNNNNNNLDNNNNYNDNNNINNNNNMTNNNFYDYYNNINYNSDINNNNNLTQKLNFYNDPSYYGNNLPNINNLYLPNQYNYLPNNYINPYYYENFKQNFSSPVLNYSNLYFQRGHLNNLSDHFENNYKLNNLNNLYNNNKFLNNNLNNLNNNLNNNNNELNNNKNENLNENLNLNSINDQNKNNLNSNNNINQDNQDNSNITNGENNNNLNLNEGNSFDIKNLIGNNNLNLNSNNKNNILIRENVNKDDNSKLNNIN
eukprot:jgi/Orpsp1_1/1189848/evm.model.d7180000074941.1